MSFDEVMIELAADRNLTYTRYADDLSFSGNNWFDLESDVKGALTSRGFELNASKTKSFKRGQPMFVTGLAISDSLRPRLRKRFKSKLRREFYFVEKYGVTGHAAAINEPPHPTANRMMGQFHYARSIEPEYAAKLKEAYPTAFSALIPQRTDDRIERARRYQQEFLNQVASAPEASLPFYVPTTALPVK